VLLPARFNDGKSVPDEWIAQALNELVAKFEAASFYADAAQGYWKHGETLYRDELGLLVVDVPDTAANRKWMKTFKARWKQRLDQLEIWMVSYSIEIE
jgi:hypothetical protein